LGGGAVKTTKQETLQPTKITGKNNTLLQIYMTEMSYTWDSQRSVKTCRYTSAMANYTESSTNKYFSSKITNPKPGSIFK